MADMKSAFGLAVANVARYGDTDVFPWPLENHVLYDRPEQVVDLLMELHGNLEESLLKEPPVVEGMLSAAGYTGFRWATQIDPLWNAYFLGLVVSIGAVLEDARLPTAKKNVFSYRFKPDREESSLFDKEVGWAAYQRESVVRARGARYVLACDISDFYPRIYHHRLENALHLATGRSDQCWRIMKLLGQFSDGVSYGLPVGGPAARLLSELLLNRVDRLLVGEGLTFCRFADDYHIFTSSMEEAYRALVLLSEKLMMNEGLLLQKSKTRVMTTEEFLGTSEFAEENEPETETERLSRDFLRLRLHYDPYSESAEEEYEELKEELGRFDVIGMIGREMRKSRIHQSLTKKLIGALRHLEPGQRDAAILSMLENIPILYPVFPSVATLLKQSIPDMGDSARLEVLAKVRELFSSRSYILNVPTNLAYGVRVLALDPSEEAEALLTAIYNRSESSAVRRDVILAMTKRRAHHWISDRRKTFGTATRWEQGALLIGSYVLGDEGSHWRKAVRANFTPWQLVLRDWASERAEQGKIEVPL